MEADVAAEHLDESSSHPTKFLEWVGKAISDAVADVFWAGLASHAYPDPKQAANVLTDLQWKRIGNDLNADNALIWRWQKGKSRHASRLLLLLVEKKVPLSAIVIPARAQIAAWVRSRTISAIRREKLHRDCKNDITPKELQVVQYVHRHPLASFLLLYLAEPKRLTGGSPESISELIREIAKDWKATTGSDLDENQIRAVTVNWLSPYTLFQTAIPAGLTNEFLNGE